MDSIFHRQNSRNLLLLQKAQRSKYTEAKKVLYPGLYVSIAGTVIFAILTVVYDVELLNTLSSFLAIVGFFITSFLVKKSNEHIKFAAKIQQTIDVELFQLPDNCHVLLPSEIKEIVASYTSSELSKFRNWYSDYSSLDFPKQILFSQKENVRWNQELGKKYSCLMLSFVIGFPILLVLYTIFANTSVASFFAIVSWIFPIEQFLITQLISLRNNIKSLERVDEEFHSIEKCYEHYSSCEIQCKLCGLQTYIFEHRKQSILIPDWFYNMHQRKMQKYEDNVASEHKSI